MSTPFDMPLSTVGNIAKSDILEDCILGKPAKATLSRLSGVFVLYITNLANSICRSENRSKVDERDIRRACKQAGFEDLYSEAEFILEELAEGGKVKLDSTLKLEKE